MEYTLGKDKVAYVLPGAKAVRVTCVDGCLWLTKTADHRDHIMSAGDNIQIGDCAKAALVAFTDTRMQIEGQRFELHELRMDSGRWEINTIKIRQADRTLRARLAHRSGLRPPWGIHGASG